MELIFVFYLVINYLLSLFGDGTDKYFYLMIPSYTFFGFVLVKCTQNSKKDIRKRKSFSFVWNRLFFTIGIYLVLLSILGVIQLFFPNVFTEKLFS